MKKIVTLLLAAVMMLTCMTGVVFAAEPGETVTIEFSSVGNPGFLCYGAQINYDATALELVEIKEGALCEDGIFSAEETTGIVGYIGEDEVTGDGVLFVATFKIKADAAPGTYDVTATLDTEETRGGNYKPVQFGISGGRIEVEEAVCEHVWGEWTVVTPATCTEAGEEKRKCTLCDVVETRVIAAKGHEHGEEWEFDDDYHWHECHCGDVADKGEHDNEWVVTKNPTHNETGLKHEECKVCDWRGDDVVIPADPNLDPVPGTGDMTMTFVLGFVAVMAMGGAALFVFKRKLA